MARKTTTQPQAPALQRGTINAEAEESVLAAVLSSPDTLQDLVEDHHLTEEDFGIPANALIWRAVMICDNAGKPYDRITVADELTRMGLFADAGGAEKLDHLLTLGVEAINVNAHAKIVTERSQIRRTLRVARQIAEAATAVDAHGDQVKAIAEEALFNLSDERRSGSGFVNMTESMAEVTRLMAIAKNRDSLLQGHSTGFRDLDAKTAGLEAGQLIIAAGRPGMGKTSFALQIAAAVAAATGKLAVFYSYEMGHVELSTRLLSSQLKVSSGLLRSGRLPDEAIRDLAKLSDRLSKLPLVFKDNPPRTISEVRSELRRLRRRSEIGIVVFDYIQLMEGDVGRRDANEAEIIGSISRGMKILSGEIGAPVIGLSQLNRQVEQRPDKRPVMSDLRSSGSLEQDADKIFFIYRHGAYYPDSENNNAEILIAKQRNGIAGVKIELGWHGETTSFSDLPEGYQGGGGEVHQPGNAGGGSRRTGGGSSNRIPDPF